MLAISRKLKERIIISSKDGPEIMIKITQLRKSRVTLAIEDIGKTHYVYRRLPPTKEDQQDVATRTSDQK